MTKRTVSATISPERLRQAQELSGSDNVSDVSDQALAVFIERSLELRWIEAHATGPAGDLPGEVPVDLSELPWDDEARP